jgi:hypothetical protein
MASENDVVLIYFEDKPAVFARIEAIEPDIKKNWYHVTLLLLTIPTQTVTWILLDSYINGSPFTMGGKPVRLEEVDRVNIRMSQENRGKPKEKKDQSGAGTVIPFKK